MRRAISVFREYCDDRKKLTYAECELRAIEQKRYYVKSDDDEDDGGSSSTDDDQNSENEHAESVADIVGPLTEGDTPLGHVEVVKQGGGPSKKPKPNDDGDDAKHPGGDLDLLANQAKHKDIGSWIYFRDTNDSRERFGYAEVIDEASKRQIHNFVKAHIADEICARA